ncbi:MAG: hypothetical protein ACD_79C01006G0001 [uncultured bacterium]|nr:MAG: hypothetical protein ACD_79C01006G0001 [uncultured bacterium]
MAKARGFAVAIVSAPLKDLSVKSIASSAWRDKQYFRISSAIKGPIERQIILASESLLIFFI